MGERCRAREAIRFERYRLRRVRAAMEMVDIANEDFVLEGCEEAVTLGKEVCQRAGCTGTGCETETAIAGFEADACVCEETSTGVVGDIT